MTPHLRCEGLGLTFPARGGPGRRIGPLTLSLGPGLHHLVGPNGAGKTTLLRCLCGGWRDSEGTVEVCGADPRRDPAARRNVALLAAEPELPPFLRVDEAWQELCALRGAASWDGAALRDALDLPGDLPIGHCSAGQRRRAELLAAAAGDPPVLLLDEPFANLDPEAAGRVAACVERWRRDRVVVVTSHGPLPMPADTVAAIGG